MLRFSTACNLFLIASSEKNSKLLMRISDDLNIRISSMSEKALQDNLKYITNLRSNLKIEENFDALNILNSCLPDDSLDSSLGSMKIKYARNNPIVTPSKILSKKPCLETPNKNISLQEQYF